MKTLATGTIFRIAAAAAALTNLSNAAEPQVRVTVLPGKARVSWTLPPGGAPNSLSDRRTHLETSIDLKHWTAEGTEASGGIGMTAVDVIQPGPVRFFRVGVNDDAPAFLAKSGAEMFGYSAAMAERLAANSEISPGNFAAKYPAAPALAAVSFDVTTADFFSEWNADPQVWNASHPPAAARLTDFRLDAGSLQKLQTNGFVVSEPRGSIGFTDLYYRIWVDDLPVYVSSDSILHAWHRTWITMLEEIEELALQPALVTLVGGVRNQLLSSNVPAALAQAKADALSYMTDANTLANYLNTLPPPSSHFPSKAVQATGAPQESIFGSTRLVDWTQFGPRAHYANSVTLQSYFRTMMWLGNIDLRIDERAGDNSLRQLGAAVVLTLALRDAGLMDEWEESDRIISAFVGRSDSMNPPQLLEILESENLHSLADFASPLVMENLLAAIQSGQAGVQDIAGHPIPAPLAEEKLVLPRSFAFFGQKFTPESWAFGQMVFDHIWRENPDPDATPVLRVHRRLPSALDIAFAVLGNDTPAELLARRMTAAGGVSYRDGHDFSRELISIREIMDSQPADSWGGTLYLHQLGALRSLSEPLPATVPEAMRTGAWKWKTVQTQLAGWTELRHDNLLYAKQSYTPPVLCYYPAGYVEPRPAFYNSMKRLVNFASAAIATLPMTGQYQGRPDQYGNPRVFVDRASRKAQWLDHFSSMSSSLHSLADIAQSEVEQVPFTTAQSDFIGSVVQSVYDDYTYHDRTYTGWYPKMYLKSAFAGNFDPHPSEMWDPLVSDVHTDAPDPIFTGDPGAVLYNATGNVGLMLVAIDVKGELCLHGGPSFTYYEFTGPYGETRLNDVAWKAKVRAREQPAHPEWTSSWLTSGPIEIPASPAE